MADKNTILELLKKLDITYSWLDHPAVYTVAEASEHIKDKRPIKNLLLEEKNHGQKVLVIMDGEQRLDTKALAQTLGTKKLGFASSEILLETLGVIPGAVSVFGLLHDKDHRVLVVVDETLVSEPELGFHPNVNTASIFLPGDALLKIITETGHTAQVITLA